MAPPSLVLAAPAKLNLYLHVTGRREDGYHLLDSLVAFADIHDVLTITPAPSLAFSADGPFAAAMGTDQAANLVVRAALALAASVGRAPDFALHLTKNLPVASGIGGGSADAAACLRGLARCWDIDPEAPLVYEAAAALGADVPACVSGRACFMGGIGGELSPAFSLPEAGLLLVNPGVALSTPSVYRARHGAFSPPKRFDAPVSDAAALAGLLADRGNDLTAPAIGLAPQIASVIAHVGERRNMLWSVRRPPRRGRRRPGDPAGAWKLVGRVRAADRRCPNARGLLTRMLAPAPARQAFQPAGDPVTRQFAADIGIIRHPVELQR
jgi:4-diphosphocytidyl-2-C-methyl-D-erythritol kinase